jgi:hypothetical protein
MEAICRQLDELCVNEFENFRLLTRGHFDWMAGLRAPLDEPADESHVHKAPPAARLPFSVPPPAAASPPRTPEHNPMRQSKQSPSRVALNLPHYIQFVGPIEPVDLQDSDCDDLPFGNAPQVQQSPVPLSADWRPKIGKETPLPSPPQARRIDCNSDSSDDELKPRRRNKKRKLTPLWARKKTLLAQLVRQRRTDPAQIFAPVPEDECPLDRMFDMPKERFQNRKDSGRWPEADALTEEEEIRFRTARGFLDSDDATDDE